MVAYHALNCVALCAVFHSFSMRNTVTCRGRFIEPAGRNNLKANHFDLGSVTRAELLRTDCHTSWLSLFSEAFNPRRRQQEYQSYRPPRLGRGRSGLAAHGPVQPPVLPPQRVTPLSPSVPLCPFVPLSLFVPLCPERHLSARTIPLRRVPSGPTSLTALFLSVLTRPSAPPCLE